MSEYNEVVADGRDDPFDSERRGYARRQVDEYIAWRNGQIRELESKLTQGLTEIERLRRELTEAREAGGRPAHEEVSERVGQILKLAADEAKAERERGGAEVAKMREAAKAETDTLRADVKEETDRLRAEAQDRAERMLTAAQEQSDRAVSSARAEADSLVAAAQQSAEQTVAEATKHADSTVSVAIAQAKQQLDDATARATAIHDGAERRLNLLISRHTETVRRLTEIRDVVTSLVAGETARGSLEDEVDRALATQTGANGENRQSSGPHDASHAGAHRAGHRQVGAAQAGSADGSRRAVAPGPLDSHPEQPVVRGPARQHTPLDREQPDPLGTDRRESARHQGQSPETVQLPADGDTDDDRRSSDSLAL
jgi:cell division septum initiation protein DivIVA